MGDLLSLLAAPFLGCLLIAALHCYMGMHVVRRGVIFVDLALAQLAALGATLALLVVPLIFGEPLDEHPDGPGQHHARIVVPSEEPPAGHEGRVEEPGFRKWAKDQMPYGLSLLFTFGGAALLTLARMRDERVPHEAIIGIVFVVSAALAVLVLSKAPHGHEAIESMLVGNILFVSWQDVLRTFLLYVPLGALHVLARRPLLRISEDIRAAESSGMRVRAWDFLFYASFGLMVTQSVKMGGVLVVFSYLIIPAVCASLLVNGFVRRLWLAWSVAVAASVIGLVLSAVKDLPTGPSLVAAFAAVLILCAAGRWVKGAMAR